MTEQKIFVKNLEINYKIIGEGEPLLILHGWGSESSRWEKVAENIGMKVIIPDLPGFGKSNKPPVPWNLDDYASFLKEMIEVLKLGKVYLLGHSFGGAVAVKYSLEEPEKVTRMMLVNSALIRKRTFKKGFLLVFSKIFKPLARIPLFKKSFYKFIVRSDYPQTEGFMRKTYLNIIKEDLLAELKDVKVPTTIIWGENDKITPLEQGKKINSKIEKSEIEIIPRIGHNPHLDIPKYLSEIINEVCC